MTALGDALAYAAQGFAIFPLHTPNKDGSCDCPKGKAPDPEERCSNIGKHPRNTNGHLGATTDAAQVRKWWGMFPRANIGIACGPSGLVVLDVDPRHGGDESYRDLVAKFGAETFATRTALTGGSGEHKVFLAPPGATIRNSAGMLGPGLDVRGDGGYFVAAPSLHASGRRYEWEDADVPLVPFPPALAALLASSRKHRDTSAPGAAIPAGQRNDTLTSLAGSMRNRGQSEAAIFAALLVTNAEQCDPPLPDDEVRDITHSVARYEPGRGAWATPDVDPETGEIRPVDARTFDHSTVGDAELLAHIHGDHLRYDHRTARWLDFRPSLHRYTEPVGGEMTRYALDAARARLERGWAAAGPAGKGDINRAQRMRDKVLLTSMLDLAHDLPPIDASGVEWDAQPHLLACTNGVLDLRTGILRPGVAGDNITRGVPVAYNPLAKAPTWERFLASVVQGDAEIVAFLLRAMGYTLTGDTTEQVLFLCHGGGANGKSTLFNVLRWAFGPELAGTVRFAAFEADAPGDASRDLAELPGKRLAIGAETPEGRTFASETVKAVTGCEPITTARKYGHPFTFTPQFKLWLGTNHLPKVKDDSEGFWRRVLVILFGAQFTGADQDRHMGDKLQAELPGILASIVRGAMDWYANGLRPPASVLMEVQAYRSREDLVAQFLADCCTTVRAAETPAKELIAAFNKWSDEQGLRGKERMSATAFGKRLSLVFEKVHRRDGWYYLGATIRDGCDGLEQFPQTSLKDFSRKEVVGKPINPSHPSQTNLEDAPLTENGDGFTADPGDYCRRGTDCPQIVRPDRPCPIHGEAVPA